MHRMYRVLAVCLLIALGIFALVSCGKEPEKDNYTITFVVNGTEHKVTVAKGETPVFNGSTDKPRDNEHVYKFIGWDREIVPATADATYIAQYEALALQEVTVRWKLAGGQTVTTTAYVGERLTPPEQFTETVQTVQYNYVFVNWSYGTQTLTELPLVEETNVGKDMVITANYSMTARTYTVTFRVDGATLTTAQLPFGQKPAYPGEGNPTKNGYTFAFWTNEDETVQGDMTCDAVFTKLDGAQIKYAYNLDLLGYATKGDDNSGKMMEKASGVLYMTMEVRANPDNSTLIRDRIVENLREFISGGKEPFFDLCPYWNYVHVTAFIAVCHETPAIWDRLTTEEKAKYDLIMRGYAYVLALGTADNNNYSTGPSMSGNFGKNWNPNYRLANVTPMIFVSRYFGGAANVNAILNAFDFDTVMGEFQTAGFTRAYARWNAEAPVKDGVTLPSAKDWMNNGGQAYHKYDSTGGRLGIKEGDPAGSGVGVKVGTYKYLGHTLDDLGGIFKELLLNCYNGGNVINDSTVTPNNNGKYVESDFLTAAEKEAGKTLTEKQKALLGTLKAFFPKMNADGTVYVNELGNWEVDSTVNSPVLGKPGMMTEFISGDGGDGKHGGNLRMSCAYGTHDFSMVAATMAAMKSLGIYNETEDKNIATFRLAWVGNTDFLFKYSHSYVSFALGAGYLSQENAGAGYFIWKSWWNTEFGHYTYDTLPKEKEPEPDAPVIRDFEDGDMSIWTVNGAEKQNGEIIDIYDDNGNKVFRYKTQCTWNRFRFLKLFAVNGVGNTYTVSFRYKIAEMQNYEEGKTYKFTVKIANPKNGSKSDEKPYYCEQTVTAVVDSEQWTTVTFDITYTQEMADNDSTALFFYFNSLGQVHSASGKVDDATGECLDAKYTTIYLDDIRVEKKQASLPDSSVIKQENYTDSAVNSNNSAPDVNGLNYNTSSKTGTTMVTSDGVLRIWQAIGAGDPLINYNGNLAALMAGYKKLEITFRMAKEADKDVVASAFRLRVSSYNTCVTLFGTDSEGNVFINAIETDAETGESKTVAKIITTLTEEYQEITVVVDFEEGTIAGYLGEQMVVSPVAAIMPGTEELKDLTMKEYLEKLTSMVFNWYMPSNPAAVPEGQTPKERVLLLDEITLTAKK